ncbi:Mrp/NBP35 family ATP-binding protein [Devosia sp. SD17-2]|jgi:ATP-binding protein involved in chromosome partitioning|uniref:Mrp/NBP35 family ATP-binding protein n=1 Tax=Devosia sp. SD17-2 TaxID=2976459 RepID=UPI0023D7DE87|nr:Mrp/NBP35 family ATP-binding protein [Devosia sp. SD17-2]WEJ32614.1 Mrp/NBP35 family ATP-binding protein [Devosia sp. SD17-2]
MADTELSAEIKSALAGVEIPGGGDLASYPGLSEIIVTPGAIAFAIAVQPGMEAAFGPARDDAHKRAQALGGARKVMVSITAEKSSGPKFSHGSPVPAGKTSVKGVRRIIAVGSGKGGVGKSTTSVNIALALAAEGLKVGILDADLYGPSVPKLLGLEGRPAIREDGIFSPHEAFGVKAISIGSMLVPGQAVVWRGPMATSGLRQLLRETDWGELDVLVIDLPPGTGDIHIGLFQQAVVDGVVIVSTPQDLALIDAQKAIDMLRRMNVPVLGLVENMSYFIAPDTGNRYDIFGSGGAEKAAADLDLEFLGAIPLVMSIRENSDAGAPSVAVDPEGPEAAAYRAIARRLVTRIP